MDFSPSRIFSRDYFAPYHYTPPLCSFSHKKALPGDETLRARAELAEHSISETCFRVCFVPIPKEVTW